MWLGLQKTYGDLECRAHHNQTFWGYKHAALCAGLGLAEVRQKHIMAQLRKFSQ